MRIQGLIFGGMALAATVAVAGPPVVDNAELEPRTLATELTQWVRSFVLASEEPVWLGWRVPMIERQGTLCCRSRAMGLPQPRACDLEGTNRGFVFSAENGASGPASDDLVVLLRASSGHLTELRAYSSGCRLDAGGRRVIWLEGVESGKSVSFLYELMGEEASLRQEALMTLALHASPLAAEQLTHLARSHADPDLRGEALFWLAHTDTPQAPEVILRAIEEDASESVREEGVFALSMLPKDRGIPLLLEILRDGSRPTAIREQAFFWYVQTGDDEALDLIVEILGG